MPLPKISLQNAVFQPTSFTGVQFTPIKDNLSLLQHSFDAIETRKEKTDQQKAQIKAAIGKLNLNAAEDEWKNNYVDRITREIDNAAQYGDYSTALEVATNLAGDVVNSPELRGRIRANEQYNEEVKTQQARRDRGDISQATYKWWLKNNPYTYKDTYDDNGNIIGGSIYEPKFRPVNDINWATAAATAFKLITPYKTSKSTEGSSSVQNGTGETLPRNGKTYKPGELVSGSSSSSFTQEKITKEEIIERMEELLGATPDGYRQAEQAYDVASNEFEDLVKEYNDSLRVNPDSEETKILGQKIDARKNLMYRNGSKIDFKEYYARMITDSLFADGLAYDWRTTASSGKSIYSISGGTSNPATPGNRGNRGGSYQSYDNKSWFVNPLWNGAIVEQNIDISGAQNEVSNIVENMENRF